MPFEKEHIKVKKKYIPGLALGLALALSIPAFAENPTEGKTTITTKIEETYTITIPADTAIAFDAESTAIGDIGLATANLAPGHQVTFTAAALSDAGVGALTNSADAAVKLPYTLKIDGAASNTVSFTTAATKPMTADITKAAWAAAPAGEYSDTITFTVTYEATTNS